MPVKLADLVRAIPADCWAEPPLVADDLLIEGLSCDSRYIKPGFLFAALVGDQTDGKLYIAAALKAGAKAILVEGNVPVADFDGAVLRAVSPRRALGLLASLFYKEPSLSMRVIGITGTDGKTSTVWILHQLLLAAGRRAAMAGTLGIKTDGPDCESWPIPLPADTAAGPRHWAPTSPEAPVFQQTLSDLQKRGVEDVVVEVSSHGLVQSRLFGTQFAVVALTHVATDHLDFHGTQEAYVGAKTMLFYSETRGGSLERRPVKAVLNLDDDLGEHLFQNLTCELDQIVTFSRFDKGDVRLLAASHRPDGISLRLGMADNAITVTTPLLGQFNEENILTAVACAVALGLSADEITQGLATISPVPGRFEAIFAGQPFKVIVDYAHTEDGLRRLLEAVAALKPNRVIVVFGCGGDRDRSKRRLMGRVAGELADHVIVTTDNPRSEAPADIEAEIVLGLQEGDAKWEAVADRRSALQCAVMLAGPGDVVVAAGKGAEAVQDFGDQTIVFDDRYQLREILRGIYETSDQATLVDPWALRSIVEMTGADCRGIAEVDWPVISSISASGVVIDSRDLIGGEVFVALPGRNVDGHDYIDQAFKSGAAAALVAKQWWSQQTEIKRDRIKGLLLLVPDPLEAMQNWARNLRRRIDPAVAAVTGSSGKTTTKEMILGLLGGEPDVIGTLENRNNEIGLPWTMLRMTEETKVLVLEMGTNHPGEIATLSRIGCPDVGLITCIGSAHEGQLGGPEGVLAAKLEITEALSPDGTLIIPDDDPVLEAAARDKWPGRIELFGFSERADVRGENVEYALDGTTLSIAGLREPLRLRLLGNGAARAALAAIAVVRALGCQPDPKALETVAPTPGRLYPAEVEGVFWLLDMYNASPESTLNSLRFLSDASAPRRKIFVFGGMQELGEWSLREHEAIGRESGFCDVALLVGETAWTAEAAAIEAGAKEVHRCGGITDVVGFLGDYLVPGDLVLLKGARSAALEKVAEALGVIDASFGKGGK